MTKNILITKTNAGRNTKYEYTYKEMGLVI